MRGDRLIAALPDPPSWLPGLITHLAGGYCAASACSMITTLQRLLEDEHSNLPQAVLERARRPGRSMGPLARALQDYFTQHQLALPTDHAQQLAVGRRRRRIDAVPEPLRPTVSAFADSLLQARDRARRASTRPRSDNTIETALATMRDLARFLHARRGKSDWATVDVTDIEAFLATLPKARRRRLTVLRQFFRFARTHRLLLIDPTQQLSARESHAFRGPTLSLAQQRALFRRWSAEDGVHPHEALVGILALLHGASSNEVRLLQVDDIDHPNRTVQIGKRPQSIPLDPVSWAVLSRALAHRDQQRTANPHVIVTKGTKATQVPASTAYLSHLLDGCSVPPRMIRSTRLVDLVNTLDPKLVAAAFGMDPQSPLIYLADHVDDDRLPNP